MKAYLSNRAVAIFLGCQLLSACADSTTMDKRKISTANADANALEQAASDANDLEVLKDWDFLSNVDFSKTFVIFSE